MKDILQQIALAAKTGGHQSVKNLLTTFVVTGGAGFLGSHLCEALINRGYSVICVDNYFTGSRDNISHLRSHPHFTEIFHDVVRPFELNQHHVNYIYNLACPASPVHYQKDPVRTVKTCVLGAINALELAKDSDAGIFQASTSEVYGDPEVHPQPESYLGNVNPLSVRACYDEGKRCAETLFFDYHRQYNLPIQVGRIFNTYGPRMHLNDGRVVSNFIVQALQQKKITIYGTGQQTRSFCYVDDLIEAILTLTLSHPDFVGPINLGSPEEFSMLALAELIISLTNSAAKIKFEPLPQDDPKQRQPNITLAKQVLNWEPKVKLKEGLIKTIAYFDKLLSSTKKYEQVTTSQ